MTQAYDVGSAQGTSHERPIGDIVTDLWEKTETLVRQEMQFGLTSAEEKVDALKIELEGKVQQLKLELFAKALGGLLAFAGLLTVVAAIVLLLGLAIKPWLAALLVGVALAAGGAALLKREVKPPNSVPHAFQHTSRELQMIEESHDTRK